MDSDTENVEYGVQIKETSTYPLNNNILYWEHINQKTKRSFSYVIIKKGIYPDKIVIRPSNKQKERTETLQDTSNIRKKRQICYEIDYIDEIPQFCIRYSPNFQYIISSTKSPSNAVLIYERTLKPRTKTTLSGPLVFGLQLESVQKACKLKRRGNLIKPADN
ncbi:6574_t:CDS:2, partial [Funneliformis caledonium]